MPIRLVLLITVISFGLRLDYISEKIKYGYSYIIIAFLLNYK